MSWPWSELGLDGPASLDEVRRAYARRVREVHPEEDPAGFQRLHTAYQEARQSARRAERTAQQPGIPMEEPASSASPPSLSAQEPAEPNSFPPPNSEAPEPEEAAEQLDFRSLLHQEEPPESPREEQPPQEQWDVQRLLQEEALRQTEQRQQHYGGGEQGRIVDRALQLVHLLFEEERPRSDWERFLLTTLFSQVKQDPQFMAGLAAAFRTGPVHNPKIREDVLNTYGFHSGAIPNKDWAFYAAISGQQAQTRRRFRHRYPRLFRTILLVNGILLLLIAVRVWNYFSEQSTRQQAQTICQYLQEDVGYPVESQYDGSKDSACLFYLPVQELTFTARPAGERDLSQGQLGYETNLANFLLTLELKDFAKEWKDLCQLEVQDEDGNSVSPGHVPRIYRISTGPLDGANCVAALGSLMDSLTQETWYHRLIPTYRLQLLVKNCVYYTYDAPEEPFDAGSLLDSYQTEARPALLYFLLEKSGLRKADFGSAPYRLEDLGVVTLYLSDFIQIGGVDQATGETTRLYFFNELYLISAPAAGFSPDMDAFTYMDFIFTDSFEEGMENLSDEDLRLVDVIRH